MPCSMIPVSSVSRLRWISLTGSGRDVFTAVRIGTTELRQLTEKLKVPFADAGPIHLLSDLPDFSLPLLQPAGVGQVSGNRPGPGIRIPVRNEQLGIGAQQVPCVSIGRAQDGPAQSHR